MELGDLVLYQERCYVLLGYTRASTTQQHAVIENAATGESETVPVDDLEPVPDTLFDG